MIENEEIIDTSTNTNTHSNNTIHNNNQHNENTAQMNPENDNKEDTNVSKDEPFCHFIFLPGQNVNVNNYTCFKCMKMKEKGNILSTLGLKSSKYYEVNYLIFINEVFLYYVVDTSTTSNTSIMRIESKSNLNDLINFYLNKVDDSNIYRFDLEFAGDNKNEEVSLFFQEKEINDFLILFQDYLVKLGILHIQQEQVMDNEEGENEYNDEYIQSGNNVDKELETGGNNNSNSNTSQLKEDDKYSGSVEDNDNQYDYGDDEGTGSTSVKKPKHKKKKKKQPKKQLEASTEQ